MNEEEMKEAKKIFNNYCETRRKNGKCSTCYYSYECSNSEVDLEEFMKNYKEEIENKQIFDKYRDDRTKSKEGCDGCFFEDQCFDFDPGNDYYLQAKIITHNISKNKIKNIFNTEINKINAEMNKYVINKINTKDNERKIEKYEDRIDTIIDMIKLLDI